MEVLLRGGRRSLRWPNGRTGLSDRAFDLALLGFDLLAWACTRQPLDHDAIVCVETRADNTEAPHQRADRYAFHSDRAVVGHGHDDLVGLVRSDRSVGQ